MASGVPQGSVLVLLLLIILISDIDVQLQSTTVRSFADNIRLVKNIERENDCQRLSEDLAKIFFFRQKEIT